VQRYFAPSISSATLRINVTQGSPSHITITQQPANGTGGMALVQQPVVQLRDIAGAATVSATTVTVAAQLIGGEGGQGQLLGECVACTCADAAGAEIGRG
jgi:hypothetical protein